MTDGRKSWSVLRWVGYVEVMRVSQLQHIRNDFFTAEMEAERTVVNRIEERILQWYGHVQRMEEERWPGRVNHWTPIGRRKRGRARLSWCDNVRKVMTRHGLQHGCANHATEGETLQSPIHCCDVAKPPYLFSGELCTSSLHCKRFFVYVLRTRNSDVILT